MENKNNSWICTCFIDIEELNESNLDKYSSMNSLIIVEAQSIGPELGFTPSRDTLNRLFEDMVSKSVQRICNKHKMMINMLDFREYTRVEEAEGVEGEDSIDLFKIVHND